MRHHPRPSLALQCERENEMDKTITFNGLHVAEALLHYAKAKGVLAAGTYTAIRTSHRIDGSATLTVRHSACDAPGAAAPSDAT